VTKHLRYRTARSKPLSTELSQKVIPRTKLLVTTYPYPTAGRALYRFEACTAVTYRLHFQI